MARWVRLGLALLVLAGCVDRRAEREAIAASFVGQTEAYLVQQAGPPTRVVEAGGGRFLVYEERRVDVISAAPGPWGPWGRPYYWGGYPTTAVEWKCETSFESKDNKIVGFTLRGNACG